MIFKRGKPVRKWTPAEVASDVETVYFGDSALRGVKAAAVVRYAYDRMTKDELAQWESDGRDEFGDRGLPSHCVFTFDFDEDFRMALYMDSDSSVLIQEVRPVFSVEEGRAVTIAWVGDERTETDFRHLPGVYQGALIEGITGVERLWQSETNDWWLPGRDEPPYIYRSYPTPWNEEPSFVPMAIPRDELAALYRSFLASPSVDSEVRKATRHRFRR